MNLEIKWTNLEMVLNEFADAFISTARANLEANNTNASRTLSDSMEKLIEIGEDWYSVKISLEDYWTYVENGRGPGKFPPPPAIKNWIQVKPVNPYPLANGKTPSVEQLAFLIGRKISREGTEGQPFFEPAKEETIRLWEDRIDEAISQDVQEFIVEKAEEMLNSALGK